MPGEGKTVGLSGHEITFVHKNPDGAYSLIEWVAAPGAPGTPLHLHRKTDEAFYVLEGTFGFQIDKQALDGAAGTFFFVRRGLEHAFWNQGPNPARLLATMSPAGFERYFEELAEGLATAGGWGATEAAMEVRKTLSERHDIEVVGSPRQAAS